MSIYLVITPTPEPEHIAHLKVLYPGHFEIAPNVWAIKTPQLSEEISKAIFPFSEGTPKVRNVIVRIDAWWGVHNPTLWEWLASAEGPDG